MDRPPGLTPWVRPHGYLAVYTPLPTCPGTILEQRGKGHWNTLLLTYISQVWVPYRHVLNCWIEILNGTKQLVPSLQLNNGWSSRARSIIDKIIGPFFLKQIWIVRWVFQLTIHFINRVINKFPLKKKHLPVGCCSLRWHLPYQLTETHIHTYILCR